jgi:serine protease Do
VAVTFLREVNNKLERRGASITVAERPVRGAGAAERDAADKPATNKKLGADAKSDKPTLGITVSELTPQLANERNLKGVRGLFIQDIDQAGIAFDAGLQPHMVIQRVNRAPVNTIDEFERIVSALKPGDPIVMHVATNNGERVAQSIVQFTFQ